MKKSNLAFALAAAIGLGACSDKKQVTNNPVDCGASSTGADGATVDAGAEAGVDAHVDARVDGNVDAGAVDAGADARIDASMDAGVPDAMGQGESFISVECFNKYFTRRAAGPNPATFTMTTTAEQGFSFSVQDEKQGTVSPGFCNVVGIGADGFSVPLTVSVTSGAETTQVNTAPNSFSIAQGFGARYIPDGTDGPAVVEVLPAGVTITCTLPAPAP